MEKVFWIKNGNLEEINDLLAKGGKVKMIRAVSEANGYQTTYAYIVVEMPER